MYTLPNWFISLPVANIFQKFSIWKAEKFCGVRHQWWKLIVTSLLVTMSTVCGGMALPMLLSWKWLILKWSPEPYRPLEIKCPWRSKIRRSKAPGDQKSGDQKPLIGPEIKCPRDQKPWRSNAPRYSRDQRWIEIICLRSKVRDQSSGDQNSGDHLPINRPMRDWKN